MIKLATGPSQSAQSANATAPNVAPTATAMTLDRSRWDVARLASVASGGPSGAFAVEESVIFGRKVRDESYLIE